MEAKVVIAFVGGALVGATVGILIYHKMNVGKTLSASGTRDVNSDMNGLQAAGKYVSPYKTGTLVQPNAFGAAGNLKVKPVYSPSWGSGSGYSATGNKQLTRKEALKKYYGWGA